MTIHSCDSCHTIKPESQMWSETECYACHYAREVDEPDTTLKAKVARTAARGRGKVTRPGTAQLMLFAG